MSEKILVVEDSPDLQLTIGGSLSEHAVTAASTLAEASRVLRDTSFDLVIMDVNLPDGDGFDFCAREPRLASGEMPLIFLTSKSTIDDKAHGFALGAEDYITKPFDPMELKLRVRARLKNRHARQSPGNVFEKGGLRFDLATQRLTITPGDGVALKIELTPLEFKLLLYFAQNSNQVLSRQQLMATVWGDDISVSDRTVDTHVSHLRKKLPDGACEIQPVYGQGYRLIP